MERILLTKLTIVSALFYLTSAQDVEYVTDIAEFSLLPPCVAGAVSYAIAGQTAWGDCADRDDQTGLQECICSDTAIHAEVSSSIVSDVTLSCGRSATQDQQSASKIYEKYCDPGFDVEFSTPTTNIVSAYITDLKEMAWLAPCASSALSGAVMQESQSRCPTEASMFAPCVCSKRDVAEDVRTTISRSVRSSCSNSDDVTLAFNFFDEYCAMNDGTSTFAEPESPPGDMSYYITALPQYKSLNKCAASALSSVVMSQTYWRCADGPQALASCVCLKDLLPASIRRDITSEVKNLCDSTATDDVSSANDVWDFYCSAVSDEVVAEVTESIEQSQPTGTVASRTGSGEGGAQETGAGGQDGSDGDEGNSDAQYGGGGSGVNETAVIVGSVLGGVIAIALIVAIAFIIRRKKKKAAAAARSPSETSISLHHSELHGNTSAKFTTAEEATELSPEERRTELQTHTQGDNLIPYHKPHEMDGSTLQSPVRSPGGVSPLSPGSRGYEGMGWQSGPTEAYEMDTTPTRSS